MGTGPGWGVGLFPSLARRSREQWVVGVGLKGRLMGAQRVEE